MMMMMMMCNSLQGGSFYYVSHLESIFLLAGGLFLDVLVNLYVSDISER